MFRNDFLDDIFWLFPDKNLCVENSLKKRETFLIPKIIEKQQVEEYRLFKFLFHF